MVTALGIDVRKAFTLVFAIGGVAAALAGVLCGVYFSIVDPQQGTRLLIFAFIVVVIGGLGSIGGTAVAAVVVGLVQQYANYYGSSGLGDLSVVLLLGVVLLAARAGSPARSLRMSRAVIRGSSGRSSSFGVLAFVPKLRSTSRTLFDGAAEHAGHAAAARALPRLRRRSRSRYDLLFGFTGLLSFGHALYFAIGVYVATIAITRWRWGFWPARRVATASSASCSPLVLGAVACASAGSRSRWSRSPSRRPARSSRSRTRTVDGRRGGPRRRLHEAAGLRSSAS